VLKEFSCDTCDKQFKRKDKLRDHVKKSHSIAPIIVEPPPPPTSPQYVVLHEQQPSRLDPKVGAGSLVGAGFLYKCDICQLGFKRRGMLVNHLAKRHPEVAPSSVPELNLPILKTTKDFYCQYCEKVYKSSSKRKIHIQKAHPGQALPVGARELRTDVATVEDRTYSQTVGSVQSQPHSCTLCHKQYASKAKLYQHQRSKHSGEDDDSAASTSTVRPPGGHEGGDGPYHLHNHPLIIPGPSGSYSSLGAGPSTMGAGPSTLRAGPSNLGAGLPSALGAGPSIAHSSRSGPASLRPSWTSDRDSGLLIGSSSSSSSLHIQDDSNGSDRLLVDQDSFVEIEETAETHKQNQGYFSLFQQHRQGEVPSDDLVYSRGQPHSPTNSRGHPQSLAYSRLEPPQESSRGEPIPFTLGRTSSQDEPQSVIYSRGEPHLAHSRREPRSSGEPPPSLVYSRGEGPRNEFSQDSRRANVNNGSESLNLQLPVTSHRLKDREGVNATSTDNSLLNEGGEANPHTQGGMEASPVDNSHLQFILIQGDDGQLYIQDEQEPRLVVQEPVLGDQEQDCQEMHYVDQEPRLGQPFPRDQEPRILNAQETESRVFDSAKRVYRHVTVQRLSSNATENVQTVQDSGSRTVYN